jgi:hypothetical protein
MPLTAYGKNEALKGATSKMAYVGLFKNPTPYAVTSSTALNGTVFNMTGAKAKGFVNGAVVVCTALTASVTGALVITRPYYVVGEATNSFELSEQESGTAIKVAGHEVTTATEFGVLVELSGGSYARVKATWGTAEYGEIEDTAAEAIKVPAGEEVGYAGWWEKASAGSGATGVYAVAKLEHAEKFTGEGEYKVTSDKLEANPVA